MCFLVWYTGRNYNKLKSPKRCSDLERIKNYKQRFQESKQNKSNKKINNSPKTQNLKTVEPKSELDINTGVLFQKYPHEGGFGERPAILVWNWSGHVALKEREEREPDTCSAAVLVGLCVCQRVVVQEQSGGDVERDEDVDGVMFMSR